jgi:hypothetical protein
MQSLVRSVGPRGNMPELGVPTTYKPVRAVSRRTGLLSLKPRLVSDEKLSPLARG